MNGNARQTSSESETSAEPQWHYALKGNRLGPVAQSQLIKMIESGKLDLDSQVWRQGMSEWVTIRRSGIAVAANLGPPPIAPDQVKNGLVWLVALVPLVDVIIIVIIRWTILSECDEGLRADCQAFLLDPSIYDTPWFAVAIVNSILCLLDERRLAKAGYSTRYLPFLALFIVPVYLFARASRLKQTPWYGFAWIGCCLLYFIL